MKKLVCITILALSILGFSSTVFATTTQEIVHQENLPLLQFPVFSDIHICSKMQPLWNGTSCDESQSAKFKNALLDLNTISPRYQAIATVGDITNQGLDVQYEEFMSILNNRNYTPLGVERIITMGNHEFFEPLYWSNPDLTDEILVDRFIKNTGVPNVYYDKWVEDYHFIVLGNESLGINDSPIFSEEQYNWLEQTLAINEDPRKPIFVFLHQPISGTVFGSDFYGGGLDNRLKGILEKYPQVILFSGHSHYLLNHPRTVYQDGFTMVNTGALQYMYYDGGYVAGSQGLLVSVYQDKVIVKARDFTKRDWIGEYEIKVPFAKTHVDQEPPWFTSDATITVTTTSTTASLELSKASDNSLVERYDILANGEKIKSEYVQFWKDLETSNIPIKLTNLEHDTEYKVEVIAVDGWKNESLPLTVTFKTEKYSGWVKSDGSWYYYDPETGVKNVGWVFDQNYWYYLDQEGRMQTGWITVNSKRYFLDSTGAMKTGWIETDGKWFYFHKDGWMQTGWVLDGSNWYYLNGNGVMQTGWLQEGSNWYYLSSNGAMSTGWVKDGSAWYYLNKKGVMQTGWIKEGIDWYYLNKSGAMQTGWIQLGSAWYFFDNVGVMKTGWVSLSKGWYYMNETGAMQTGWVLLDGVWYYFNDAGLWVG